MEILDCSECSQLSQEAFITLARTPIVLPRLRCLHVPTDLTLPNAVFESLANSPCLPALEVLDNIQPGSSVCHPLRCQVHAIFTRIFILNWETVEIYLKDEIAKIPEMYTGWVESGRKCYRNLFFSSAILKISFIFKIKRILLFYFIVRVHFTYTTLYKSECKFNDRMLALNFENSTLASS